MRLHQSVQYGCIVAIIFASCRASRTVAVVTNEEVPQTLAVAASLSSAAPRVSATIIDTNEVVNERMSAVNENEGMPEATSTVTVVKMKKKITSFSQMKEMARSGELQMSKKDLKTLNRLEKHYKGNYQKFRADAFELTDKAKIIGGVGLLGLLLAIITGSAFGWFLFVLAALAFLLRYLDIIAF